MLIVFSFLLVTALLLLVLTLVSFIISEYIFSISREELSSYECGFEHHSLSRLPLSLRYFILTLVFLIFDMEVILLSYYPLFSASWVTSLASTSIYLGFLFILLFGLLFEWTDGSLDWVI